MKTRRQVVTQIGLYQITIVEIIIDPPEPGTNRPMIVIAAIGLQIGSGIQHMEIVGDQILTTGIHLLVQLPLLRKAGKNMERMFPYRLIIIDLCHHILVSLGNIALTELTRIRRISQWRFGIGIKVLYDVLLLFPQHIDQPGSILNLCRQPVDNSQSGTEIQRGLTFMVIDKTTVVGLCYRVCRATAISPLPVGEFHGSQRRRTESLIEKSRIFAIARCRSPIIHVGITHISLDGQSIEKLGV